METIIPSILNCDLKKISNPLIRLFESGVKNLHFDVMDKTLNTDVFDGFFYISQLSDILIKYNVVKNVHLITSSPENYIPQIRRQKVEQVSFHNINFSISYIISLINKFKKEVRCIGLVLSPHDTIDLGILNKINFVHICTKDFETGLNYTNEAIINLILKLKPIINNIQIDGGVTFENISLYHKLGVNYFIVGNAIFSNEPLKSYFTLKSLIDKNSEA